MMTNLSRKREAVKDDIIRRWNAGDRASAIAMAHGITRNAVIGIVNRAKPKGLITRVERPSVSAREEPKEAVAVRLPPPAQAQSALEQKPTPVAPRKEQERPAVFPPPVAAGAGPRTLIDAPLFTCRFVVGQNEAGQDLYCCEPIYRQKDGKIGRISCCEVHKPRMFSKRSLGVGAPDQMGGAIDRISTSFQREQRADSKKFFAFGTALKGRET